MSAERWLVVGLGNPGPGYAGNRHNVGQLVLDELATRLDVGFRRHRTSSAVAEGRFVPGGPQLILAKPNSFMNLSGSPVSQLLAFYALQPDRLIVVHDELDLPFNTLRLKLGGGHGGHNGIRDVLAALGSGNFIRVRVGIGRPPGRQAAAEYVLRDFPGAERERLPMVLSDAADAVQSIIGDGLAAAQLRFHTAP